MPRQKEFDYNDKLIAARNLFWEKGYNATSLNDLVNTLKINRSSLYLTYGGKHELFLKCLSSYLQLKSLEYNQAASKEGENPLEAAKNVVWSVLKVVMKDTKTCMFVNSTFELARIDGEVKAMLKKQTNAAVQMLEVLLKRAQEHGLLKAGKDPKALALFLITGIVSLWQTQILYEDDQLTQQMARILLGVLTD